MIKAVIFDCDGVLIDSEPVLAEISAKYLNDEYDLPAKPEDFAPWIGTGEDTYIGKVVEQYGGTYTEDIKEGVYQAYLEGAPGIAHEVPGASELIHYLKTNGYKVAVASSADAVKLNLNLSILEAGSEPFDAIISGSDIERKKPFPDIYLLAAEQVGTAPEHCLVIEDATAGIESGNRAGMTTVALTTSVSRQDFAAFAPDCTVDRLESVREALERGEFA